jgi:hypothetical protein
MSALLSNFMILFTATLTIESVRQYFLPFSKLLNTGILKQTAHSPPKEEKSELERDVDNVKREMQQMIKEAE